MGPVSSLFLKKERKGGKLWRKRRRKVGAKRGRRRGADIFLGGKEE